MKLQTPVPIQQGAPNVLRDTDLKTETVCSVGTVPSALNAMLIHVKSALMDILKLVRNVCPAWEHLHTVKNVQRQISVLPVTTR